MKSYLILLLLATSPAFAASERWLIHELASATGKTLSERQMRESETELVVLKQKAQTSVPRVEQIKTRVLFCAGATSGGWMAGAQAAVCLNHRSKLNLNLMGQVGLSQGTALNLFALIFRARNLEDVPGVYMGLKAGAGLPLGVSVGAFRKVRMEDESWVHDESATDSPKAYLIGAVFGRLVEVAGAILWVTPFEMGLPRLGL